MRIVVAGHVDDGKSTVIGRLLADTGSLPEGKLDQVRAECDRSAKPFEYAFLLDALEDERAQGITIDTARVAFQTARRRYLILDAPGHVEFTKNMITGASHADAALLVIDASEGVRENSRRHGYLLAMLGIPQIAVLVNKMDLVDYREDVFRSVADEYATFLAGVDVQPSCVLPISARAGANVVERSASLPWFDGPTVVGALDAFPDPPAALERPFRMPVQDVYKFARAGDDRRIVAGTVASGVVTPGDEVVFLPSGKRSTVGRIESFGRAAPTQVGAGEATGFTLAEQLYVRRGEVAAKVSESPPHVSSRLEVSLFWLGHEPMATGKEYVLRLGSARVAARLESIERVLDTSSLAVQGGRDRIGRHEAAEVVLRLKRPIAFDDWSRFPETGRFVLVDDYDIRGGGIVRSALPDDQAEVRRKVFLRNNRWEKSFVGSAQRAERYNQKAALVLVTGPKDGRRKEVAKALEQRRLFEDGRMVHYLGFGSVLYGVDADLGGEERESEATELELMRRLGEVAHILLDAGLILIVTARALTQRDLDVFRTTVDPDQTTVAWVGEDVTTDIAYDLDLGHASDEEAVGEIKSMLRDRGILFSPW